jgi:hypothetical protein
MDMPSTVLLSAKVDAVPIIRDETVQDVRSWEPSHDRLQGNRA